jgi:5-methylcytosine-specific restriction endonuclease McrA
MKRNAFVEVVSVKKLAKWQDWKCYHCGRKIDPTKTAPHPRSLTLDHLVPLALGGEHSYANTAASCWDCNCKVKGVRAIGEQLKLA